jgi:hypothetical protein
VAKEHSDSICMKLKTRIRYVCEYMQEDL